MNIVDLLVAAGLGLGFFRGRKRGMGLELYKLINIGIPILMGCGLFTLAGRLVGLIPGLDGEQSGLLGFLAVFGTTLYLLRTSRVKLKAFLVSKFGEVSSTMAGLAGTVRMGIIGLGALTGIHLSPARFITDGSLFGKMIGTLLGMGGS